MPASRPDSRPPLVVQAVLRAARFAAAAARFVSPHLATAGRTVAGLLASAGRRIGSIVWRARGVGVALAVRALWWASLLLGTQAWLTVVDTSQALDVDSLMQRFAIGLALCAAVTALASARHVRWAAIALGTVHGASVLLLHSL